MSGHYSAHSHGVSEPPSIRLGRGSISHMDQKPPTATIESANRDHLNSLPFADTRDFEDADRGFIAAQQPCVIKAADGRVVWDNDVYAFLSGDAPTSVHPSLWRQSQPGRQAGPLRGGRGHLSGPRPRPLEHQLRRGRHRSHRHRSADLDRGGRGALTLYREHRGGDRPVVAVIYTHSHADHFGGVLGRDDAGRRRRRARSR